MHEEILMNIKNNTIAVTILESCMTILEQDVRTMDLVEVLAKRRDEIENENDDFLDKAAGGEFDFDKVF